MFDVYYLALLIVAAAAAFNIIGRYMRKNFVFRYSLVVLIGAVFAGLVLINYPTAFAKYQAAYPDAGGFTAFIISAAQSVQSAFRTFVLDGEWSEILSGKNSIPLHATIIGLTLNVLAPVLTFSAILSLFNQLRERYRFFRMRTSGRYLAIMSELNKDSIFLAEDIMSRYHKANIVYTDVYPENDETNFELREKARKLNAALMRCDKEHYEYSRQAFT